ncbi:hypothetical protein [Sphingomonas sanxanigenens]|uniref:Uncharacterized protein n=1 Tax=Sphingomonas sanxanigenens DSM 19645 = NX02 TaxID=1123269 RepID=W0A7Z0_9SPHN|nr:hypothetical protein [Sphingomonas sanxanigenens]AHE52587.1 hypothetical protein NX02_04195 [Sphingomonas sanxanigenens DSM 19645 = NX02]
MTGAVLAAARAAATLAVRHWPWVLAGTLVAALALALLLARGEARRWQGVAADRDAALAAERAGHAVSRASVATLEAALAESNAQSHARADALAAARAAAAAADVAADARWQGTAAQVARLRALAAQPALPGCAVSKALIDALEGL